MMSFFRLNTLLLVLVTTWTSAQQTALYSNENQDFNKAVLLYKEKQFQAAQILFDQVKTHATNQELVADCDFYIANCAIRTN